MTHPEVKVEKIDITDLFKLKATSNRYYIVIPKPIVYQYGLNVGHFLKVHIKEVRKPFEEDAIE